MAKLYGQHENQKKRHYLNRILQVEKGTFSPLVFTTTGGMGPEATRFLKRVAVKLAAKTREKYNDVMNNIRTRISFEILRSVLVAVRGVSGLIMSTFLLVLRGADLKNTPSQLAFLMIDVPM